jgi:hypothetical protein
VIKRRGTGGITSGGEESRLKILWLRSDGVISKEEKKRKEKKNSISFEQNARQGGKDRAKGNAAFKTRSKIEVG